MALFDSFIRQIQAYVSGIDHKRTWPANDKYSWPSGGNRNIVLKEDLGLELGSPDTKSLSCILWTENAELIQDGSITLIGPDIPQLNGEKRPFAKIVLAGVRGFNEENTYDRYRDMELIRYTLDLKGYMLRAASMYQIEWSRISSEAINRGFSFDILGSALMKMFRGKPYVKTVEIIYVTSSTADVGQLKEITSDTFRIISAMNKMAQEMDLECDECEYQDVCDDAGELKKMREAKLQKTSGGSS